MLSSETERADDKLVVMVVNQKKIKSAKREEELTRKAKELRKVEEASMFFHSCFTFTSNL